MPAPLPWRSAPHTHHPQPSAACWTLKTCHAHRVSMSLALQPIVYGTGHIGLLSASRVACLFQPTVYLYLPYSNVYPCPCSCDLSRHSPPRLEPRLDNSDELD